MELVQAQKASDTVIANAYQKIARMHESLQRSSGRKDIPAYLERALQKVDDTLATPTRYGEDAQRTLDLMTKVITALDGDQRYQIANKFGNIAEYMIATQPKKESARCNNFADAIVGDAKDGIGVTMRTADAVGRYIALFAPQIGLEEVEDVHNKASALMIATAGQNPHYSGNYVEGIVAYALNSVALGLEAARENETPNAE